LPKPVQAPIKILKTTQDESKGTFVDDYKEEDINNNVEKNLHKSTEIDTVCESSLEVDIDTNSDNAQSEVVCTEGFNEKVNKNQDIQLEKMKLEIEKRKIDLEFARLEAEERKRRKDRDAEERQRQNDREHQMKVIKMIMDLVSEKK
jgi:hypothetical protein